MGRLSTWLPTFRFHVLFIAHFADIDVALVVFCLSQHNGLRSVHYVVVFLKICVCFPWQFFLSVTLVLLRLMMMMMMTVYPTVSSQLMWENAFSVYFFRQFSVSRLAKKWLTIISDFVTLLCSSPVSIIISYFSPTLFFSASPFSIVTHKSLLSYFNIIFAIGRLLDWLDSCFFDCSFVCLCALTCSIIEPSFDSVAVLFFLFLPVTTTSSQKISGVSTGWACCVYVSSSLSQKARKTIMHA